MAQLNSAQASKRQLEGQVSTMQEEVDDAENECKNAQEKYNKECQVVSPKIYIESCQCVQKC